MKPDFSGTWNAQADAYNTWLDLSEDERLEWAFNAGLERAAEIAGKPCWHSAHVGLMLSAAIRAEKEPQ